MDNERPIEKLLRDYAKKRRADAGAPLEMHPTTRRLLQGEVARQFPKAKRDGSAFLALFARWRPGLIYGTCILAVVAISVALLSPNFRKGSPQSQLAKVRSDEELADKNLQAAAPTMSVAPEARESDEKLSTRGPERSNEGVQNALAFTDTVAKDDARGLGRDLEKEKSLAARPLGSEALVRNAPASPPPATQITSLDQTPKRTVEAQGRLESAQDSRRVVAEEPAPGVGGISLAARSPNVAPSPTGAPLAASADAAFKARYGIPAAKAESTQSFSQLANTARFRRSPSTGTSASPVLTTFQLEQTGDQLSVIDSDGSTYSGTISSLALGALYETKAELKGGPVTKPGESAAAKPIQVSTGDKYQAGQNYFFRVTGTNRTLKQPVVFEGNLLIWTNALPAGQTVVTQTSAARSQNQSVPTKNQLPGLLNSSISGKVQLGTNKELPINAVPVSP